MCCVLYLCCCFFFFKQKTAYEMRISDWSSDVCSSDLFGVVYEAQLHPEMWMQRREGKFQQRGRAPSPLFPVCLKEVQIPADERTRQMFWNEQIGRASCRERVCQYV